MYQKNLTRLTPAALALTLAGMVAAASRAQEPTPVQPVKMSLAQARQSVAMLNDLYVNAVELTHETYVTDRGTAVAATVARQVFEAMAKNGWPETHWLATTERPSNPANNPTDAFDNDAVAALGRGQRRFERIEGGRLRVGTLVPLVDKSCRMCDTRYRLGDPIGGLSYAVQLSSGAPVASAGPRPTAGPGKRRAARKAAAAHLPGMGAMTPTRAMTPKEARTAVAMLDDAYHLILEKTHAAFHARPTQPVAATVVRKLQARMTELGWPRARFLAVNALVMHPDHVPRDDFEGRTVHTLRDSDQRIEQVVNGQLRVSTVVSLGGGCASCHWTPPGKTSKAALTFAVPLRQEGGRGR